MKYNYGIALLRFFLAFGVVGAHFGSGAFPFNIISPIAVPCFMMLSSIFLRQNLDKFSLEYCFIRLKKLCIPYLIWPILYIYVYSSLYSILGVDLMSLDWKSALFYQLVLGHSILPVLWFHWCLILLTVLTFILFYIGKKYIALFVLGLFTIVAFGCQYSQINWNLFSPFRYEIRYPLGRFLEVLPYCFMGLIIGGGGEKY